MSGAIFLGTGILCFVMALSLLISVPGSINKKKIEERKKRKLKISALIFGVFNLFVSVLIFFFYYVFYIYS